MLTIVLKNSRILTVMNNIQLGSVISLVMGENRGIDRKICQERPAKVRAKYRGVSLVKRSTWWCRFVGYESQKSVQEARENGMGYRPNNWISLSDYCDGLYYDPSKKSFKLGIGHSAFAHERSKEWILDGEVVSFEEVKHMLLAQEYAQNDGPNWFTIYVENIVSIDGQEVIVDVYDIDMDDCGVKKIENFISEVEIV